MKPDSNLVRRLNFISMFNLISTSSWTFFAPMFHHSAPTSINVTLNFNFNKNQVSSVGGGVDVSAKRVIGQADGGDGVRTQGPGTVSSTGEGGGNCCTIS